MFDFLKGDQPPSWVEVVGDWAGVLAPFTALLVAYLTIRWSNRAQKELNRASRAQAAIDNFYQPVLSLLLENKVLFNEFGPGSWDREDPKRSIQAKTWDEIKTKHIRENNIAVAEIITKNFSLALRSDRFENYSALLKHIRLFEIYHEHKTERINQNRFPQDVITHVETMIKACQDK